jgi:aspartate/methionine/tyrosine aminotransferase
MNPLAESLNETLKTENPYVLEMLSDLGKNFYYPKGILSQSAEAKQTAHKFNATIGMATEDGEPMHLKCIQDTLSEYSPKDLYPYAPPEGKRELRSAWKKKMLKENPSLKNMNFSNPIVTNALTHGLSIAADLFVDYNDPIIVPDKYWGNYNLIFGLRRGAKMTEFPLFNNNGGFNTEEYRKSKWSQKDYGKVIVLLNFPNNPTGYTPSVEEINEISSILLEAAESGINIVCIIDDAYFQLFFEDSIKESIFSLLVNLHPRILPIKIDGATKEEYVWGFRVGFITYGNKNNKVLEVLEQKSKGLIRSTISSASHPAQTFVLKAINSPKFWEEKNLKFDILKRRANKVKKVLLGEPRYNNYWSFYPFNSGYFMCLKLFKIDAEVLRKHLLKKYQIGTIAINSTDLRIAFSCVEENDIEELFECIYQGIQDLCSNSVLIE